MAPTKANATYAVTTLSLLTAMGSSLFTSLPASNADIYQAVPGGKVRLAVRAPRNGDLTWLKTREINMLKSL